ncbi:MAG TPA: C25 family cysteine peptidase [Ignavibacteria bacterium]
MKKRNSIFSLILKVNFIVSLLLLLLVSNSFAQVLNYNNPWGADGITLTSSKSSGVEINFSMSKLYLEDVNVNGVSLKAAKIPGIFLPNDAGKPDLAGTGRYIAIPRGAQVAYRIITSRIETIKNVDIAPAPVIPKDNDPSPLKYNKDLSVYNHSNLYPENPVMISQVSQIRGVDIVMLGVTPFQYNPSTKELTVFRDIKIEITFTGGNGQFGDPAFRSIWWEPILSDAILNYSSLPVIDFAHRYSNIMDVTGYEYVIIVPNAPEFSAWADTVKKFRSMQGIKTGIFKLSDIGGNDVTLIKNWVTNIYNTWTIKPAAICLMADYGTDANTTIISKLQPDSGYPDFASDNYYADVNGDEMPEIVFSRIIANNASELQTLITKNINYEKSPPTSPYFYAHPITALGWQTERWFQLCSELVGGYFKKIKNKLPTRINKVYSGTPGSQWSTATNTATVVNYFGTTGLGYIPMSPDSLGGFDGGTPTQVVNAINAGSFLLQHRDHGMYTGWGEPGFTTSYASQLTNTDLTFIFSINCETGAYHNPSGCPPNGSFVEVFYRYKYNGQNSGALGMVCPSEVSYSFVNDTYVWGMYDNMWPDFMPGYGTTPPSRDEKPAFGMAAGKFFLQQSSWPYNTSDKLVTYRLFHMHGDAFLNLYSEVPQNLTVAHNPVILSGVTSFDVTANAGSFIAITNDTTILGTATGTGSPVSISIPGTQIPGQSLKVTITKQNYYRYSAPVNVIPPSGPYCVKDSVAINDASPLGNGNGLMDYGETNKLALRLKNVGSAVANGVNVKVTTTNTYITMTDSLESFGNINAGATVLKTDAFAYTVANNIPDYNVASFKVIVTSGSDTWISYFDLTAHSACIKYNNFTINDSAGNNNGRFDAGETVGLKIKIKNSGSSMVNNVVGVISANDPYITLNTTSNNYGNIAAGDSAIKSYSISSAANTPTGYQAKINLVFNGNLGISCTDSLKVTVGQNIAVIGNGTTGCDYPFYTYYDDARTQMLYTAPEIIATGVASGNVTRIGFEVTSASSQVMNGFNVRMQNYSGTSLSSYVTSGFTTVYSPTSGYTVPGTGWQYIDLTTPFQWNGTSSLLIEICYNNSTFTTSTTINGTPNSLNQLKHAHQDILTGDGCVAITTPSSSYTARPNINLTINAIVGINNGMTGIPNVYSLSQNYPNPFNPVTKISYAIPKSGLVTMKIYDVLGRELLTLVNQELQAGYYMVDFDGTNFASGVYYYRLESGTFTDTKKLMLIK